MPNGLEPFLDKVIQGDVLKVLRQLPDESVDVGVTSPPYNKGAGQKGWLVDRVKYQGATDKRSEEEYQAWQIEVLNELWRVTKPGGSFFYNHKLRWRNGVMFHPYAWVSQTKWVVRQELIWDRMIAANLRGWRFWQVDERIYWLYKPISGHRVGTELKSRHALLTSIWRFPPERDNPHPAPFPLALPLRAIYAVMDEAQGSVVIDPFAGSGTTLVAAKILGHYYIGIELSATYVKMANERLKHWKSELPKAQEELAKHKVKTTFQERKAQGKFTGRYRPQSRKTVSTPQLFELEKETAETPSLFESLDAPSEEH